MTISRRLVLASQSLRRIHLLRQIGLDPEVIPSSVEETFLSSLSVIENATMLAVAKAEAVGRLVKDGIVIGADTIVALGDEMLGKPEGKSEAAAMLRKLSGRTHEVVTAFALLDRPSNRSVSEAVKTLVSFRNLPEDEIREYVEGGSPLDKAGAYGIQDDYGAVFVSRIEGCYYNVVGLPLSRFHAVLNEFTVGVN